MKPIALLPLVLLAACGPSDPEPASENTTAGEARALGEAAEMIEQRRRPPETTATPDAQPSPASEGE